MDQVERTIPGEVGELFASFARHLRAAGRSPRTAESYGDAVGRLVAFAGTSNTADITTTVVRDWLVHEREVTSPGSVGIRYRSVRAFFRWLEAEGEIDRSPMTGVPHPAQPDTPVEILTAAQIRKLIAATNGTDWRSRRDKALVLFLLDTGCRRGEVAGLEVADVNLDRGEATVTGKGSHTRVVSLGTAAVAAIDRWLRARRKLPYAERTEALWVSDRGPLSDEGIRQVLKRLGNESGVGPVHPHQFRHTAGHILRANGMGDAELMELMGWKSAAMLQRYGRSAVGARAREQHKRIAPGDQL